MNIAELIDQFVIVIDPAGNIFRRVESAPWISALEERLPARLPASFRSLVTRYCFEPFDAGSLYFFGNRGTDSHNELSVAIFNDQFIAGATLQAGYIQFARPLGGSYDPVCFDARRPVSNREFPIVRLDHEKILCRERVHSVPVSDSFYKLIVDLLSRA